MNEVIAIATSIGGHIQLFANQTCGWKYRGIKPTMLVISSHHHRGVIINIVREWAGITKATLSLEQLNILLAIIATRC